MVTALSALAAAGAVLTSAAWRSTRPAARQGLLPQPAQRRLPWLPGEGLPAVRALGRATALALLVVAVAGPALGAPGSLLAAGGGWVLVLWLSAVTGALWPGLSPLRLLPARPARLVRTAEGVAELGSWPAAGVLATVALVAHSARPGPPVASAALVAGVAAGAVATLLLGRAAAERLDPLAALASVTAVLAPVGRDAYGWVLTSPAPRLARHGGSRGARALLAVIVGAALAHQLDAPSMRLGDGALAGVPLLAGCTVGAGLAIRIAAFRSYLVPAVMAAAAGWTLAHHAGLLLAALEAPGAVRLLLALGALLAGHLVAIGAAHRAALARFDPRAARAVQFPLRAVLAVSSAGGTAMLVS